MGALTRTNAIHAPHLLARSHEKGGVCVRVCGGCGVGGVAAAFMKDATKGRHSSGSQRQNFGPGPARAVSCTLALFVTQGASVLSAYSFYFLDLYFLKLWNQTRETRAERVREGEQIMKRSHSLT